MIARDAHIGRGRGASLNETTTALGRSRTGSLRHPKQKFPSQRQDRHREIRSCRVSYFGRGIFLSRRRARWSARLLATSAGRDLTKGMEIVRRERASGLLNNRQAPLMRDTATTPFLAGFWVHAEGARGAFDQSPSGLLIHHARQYEGQMVPCQVDSEHPSANNTKC